MNLLPEMSNSACLPGRAGEPPFLGFIQLEYRKRRLHPSLASFLRQACHQFHAKHQRGSSDTHVDLLPIRVLVAVPQAMNSVEEDIRILRSGACLGIESAIASGHKLQDAKLLDVNRVQSLSLKKNSAKWPILSALLKNRL